MTNDDRLRASTDEEIAVFFERGAGSSLVCPMKLLSPRMRYCKFIDDCYKCVFDWLREEVQKDG